MRTVLLIGTSTIAVAAIGPALSQDVGASVSSAQTSAATQIPATGATPGDTGEIVVTATKREQSLQKVPVSVSVTTEATLEQAQIRDLIDLQSVVPSLKVQQFSDVGQTNFTIRGFGNGAGNDGIESSVGVFVDGVYRSRAGSALDDLPEIERIEVLRGPQSTLFGKNVSAGAINIVTARPQFTWGGKAELSLGNYGLVESRSSITGPISDTLAFRLSETTNDRDGTYRNQVTGTKLNDRDRFSLRGDLLWKPTDTLSVRLLADYNQIHEVCCAVVSVLNGPATQFIGAPAPFGLGAAVSTPQHDNRDVALDADPRNRVKNEGVSGQIDWNLGHATLTSITAYRHSADQSFTDVDFTGADLATSNRRNSIDTFTQEVRLASDGTSRFNYLVGGFYEHEHLNSGVDTTYGSQIRTYADALSGQIPAALLGAIPAALRPLFAGHSNIYALEQFQAFVTPSIVPGATYFQAGQGIHDFYTLKQDSYSIFGQADYKLTDRLTLTGGIAYLNDRKKGASDVVLNDPFSSLNLSNVPQFPLIGLPANLYSALSALQFFYANDPNHGPVNFPNVNESGKLKGDKVTYTAHAAYDLGIVNAYLTYSTGWKAGAYNLSSDGRPPDANGVGRTAAPENVTLYEAGLKAHFHGGFFNLAVFHQAIKGFQSNAYTGTGFSLVNAGKESVTGFEIDSAYQPISWLSLTGAVTYLHPKYNSFDMAPCVTYDTVRCPIDPATGLTPNFRDLSGTRPATIPTWTTSVAAVATHRFSDDLSGYVRGEFDYTSKAQLIETTPPDVSRYGNKEVDASISISSRRYQAEVMLWGRNLTNFYTLVTTFPTVAQTGSYSGIPNQPRTYGVTLRKSF